MQNSARKGSSRQSPARASGAVQQGGAVSDAASQSSAAAQHRLNGDDDVVMAGQSASQVAGQAAVGDVAGAAFRIANGMQTVSALESAFEQTVHSFMATLSGEGAADATMSSLISSSLDDASREALASAGGRKLLLEGMRQLQDVVFTQLRGFIEPAPRPDDLEPLDHELAATVDSLTKQANELAAAVEKRRDTLEFSAPAQVRADFGRRRAQLGATLEGAGLILPSLHAGGRADADTAALAGTKRRRSSMVAADAARAAATVRAEAARAAVQAAVEPALDTGLRAGLAISREIMEDVGGSLAAQASGVAAATRDVGDTQCVLDAVLTKGPAPIDVALKATATLAGGASSTAPRAGRGGGSSSAAH